LDGRRFCAGDFMGDGSGMGIFFAGGGLTRAIGRGGGMRRGWGMRGWCFLGKYWGCRSEM
jgi:hypothetical protein